MSKITKQLKRFFMLSRSKIYIYLVGLFGSLVFHTHRSPLDDFNPFSCKKLLLLVIVWFRVQLTKKTRQKKNHTESVRRGVILYFFFWRVIFLLIERVNCMIVSFDLSQNQRYKKKKILHYTYHNITCPMSCQQHIGLTWGILHITNITTFL